jgi:hypothetical protein
MTDTPATTRSTGFPVDAPWIEVDTTDGYRPGLREMVAFVNAGGSRRQPQAADGVCEPDT